MTYKFRIGITGATGRVGRTAIGLIDRYLREKFVVTYLGASPRSAGKKYGEVVADRWSGELPSDVANLVVEDANVIDTVQGKCDLMLSAIEIEDKNLSKEQKEERIRDLEDNYAVHGIPVVSNNSAHRWTPFVPMIIPEINPEHLDAIRDQQEEMHWNKGFIVVKPNCSIQSFMMPVHALMRKGYDVTDMAVVTQQALSGAGDSGPAAVKLIDNRYPNISGEEEKTYKEPLKIFGTVTEHGIIQATYPRIGSICTRDSVIDGHSANVMLRFGRKKPSLDQVIECWNSFKAPYSTEGLCMAPEKPLVYRSELGRPTPELDRDTYKGMAVTVGGLKKCNLPFFDIQFTGLSHNMIRGAVGCGLLTAELLLAKEYIQ